MKIRTLTLFLIVCVMTPTSYALDAPDAESVIPFSERYGELLDSGLYNLLSEGNSLGETGFDVHTRLSLGCDGSLNGNMFSNFANNIERQYNHMKNNALGYSINYLAYESPTFMQIIRFMNQDFDQYFENMVFTCQSVRNMAQRTSRDQDKLVERQNECINSGTGDLLDAATTDCVNEKEQEDLSEIMADTEDAQTELVSSLDNISSDNPVSPALSGDQKTDVETRFTTDNPDSLALVLTTGMTIKDQQLQWVASQLLDSVSYVDQGSNGITRSITRRTKTFEEVLKNRQRYYMELLDDYVDSTLSKDVPTSTDIKGEMDIDKALQPPSPPMLTSLINIKKYNEGRYKAHLKVLSRVMAKSYLRYYIAATGGLIKNSVTKGILAEPGFDLERETLENSLVTLRQEMALMEVRDEGLAEQNAVLRIIMRDEIGVTPSGE